MRWACVEGKRNKSKQQRWKETAEQKKYKNLEKKLFKVQEALDFSAVPFVSSLQYVGDLLAIHAHALTIDDRRWNFQCTYT